MEPSMHRTLIDCVANPPTDGVSQPRIHRCNTSAHGLCINVYEFSGLTGWKAAARAINMVRYRKGQDDG